MTTLFEKSDEWGGYTIRLGSSGFIIDYHTHVEGELDGIQIVVPYGTWGFWAVMNLDAPYDEIVTNGEALADMALRDAGRPVEEQSVKVLDAGEVLSPSTRRHAAIGLAAPGASVDDETSGARRDAADWYTFSLPKVDEDGYGRCHDLFAQMYLTHGLPHGMALWTTSNFDTDENMFFARIPHGMDVKSDPFFMEFAVTECPHPPKVGLALLVGHDDEHPKPSAASGKGMPWRRNQRTPLRTATA